MIIVKAPLRISFVGGGTDLPDFYRKHPGRVISTAIDKYVYVAINHTPHINNVVARYSDYELVKHPSEVKNDRIREALLDLGIHSNVDVTTFSQVPIKTGLGGSSSFSVALMKGLHEHLGKKISQQEVAEAASRLEIDLIKEPIGKQDQYASAFGGMNIFQFNPDDSVDVQPVYLDYETNFNFQNHLLLFFTGVTRAASSVLTEQKKKTDINIETLKKMADLPVKFRELLVNKDFEGLGILLHNNWLHKKELASNISNSNIDDMYQSGLDAGAWGGKILGAGSGGCILFLASAEKHDNIRKTMIGFANKQNLKDFAEISFKFVQSGAEILYKDKT